MDVYDNISEAKEAYDYYKKYDKGKKLKDRLGDESYISIHENDVGIGFRYRNVVVLLDYIDTDFTNKKPNLSEALKYARIAEQRVKEADP